MTEPEARDYIRLKMREKADPGADGGVDEKGEARWPDPN
jgi:hypothetical protein